MGTFTSLHDPACIWYAMDFDNNHNEPNPQEDKWTVTPPEDIRIETQGQWTRGMCVIDRRDRKMLLTDDHGEGAGGTGIVETDHGGWLSKGKGNRVRRCVGTPGDRELARVMLEGIFGG